jgi:hypothetical protein
VQVLEIGVDHFKSVPGRWQRESVAWNPPSPSFCVTANSTPLTAICRLCIRIRIRPLSIYTLASFNSVYVEMCMEFRPPNLLARSSPRQSTAVNGSGIYKKSRPTPTLSPRARRSPLRAMRGMEKLSSMRRGSKLDES